MKKSSRCLNLIIDGEQYALNTDKLLVGSAQHADIRVDSNSISHYHALIFVTSEGQVSVMDLESQNGTYINGERVQAKTPIFDGDNLTLGKVHCELIESTETVTFESQEAEVQVFEELQSQRVYVPEATNENEVLIDDEYCDIVFDDETFNPLTNNPLQGKQVDSNEYIETEWLEDSFDIREQSEGQCIQVTTSLSGTILEQYYFPMQDGSIQASNSKKSKAPIVVDILNSKETITLFSINNGKLEVEEIEDFHLSQKQMSLTDNSVIVLSRGTYQIFIEVADAPSTLTYISPLLREKEFFKDTAKKFAGVLLPMLLLLLVDFSIEKEEKKLSIIYKKPVKTNVDGKKMASTNPNDNKKNTGHKTTKQPDKKVAHSKKGKKAQPKKSPKKAKAVAKAKAAKPSKSPTKAKTKAYSFKMASNVSSVFSSSKTVAVANNNAPSAVKTTSNVSGSLATKVNGTSSSQIGSMGSDAAGRALASFGTKGLSSKSGRDTAYIQTETVVLGSMDPELLRKILQQYLPQFRHCYQQELAYNSDDIKGIVDLNFEISASGKVGKINVRAKDSRFSKRGTNCMAKVLAIIDFPKPKGGGRVAVRQPLSFFSEQEKG